VTNLQLFASGTVAMDFALLVPIVGQTMFRPLLTALVTSKQELDAALATADQITVEGDDDLLSYAVSKAANDPGNRVSVEIGEQSVTVEPVEAFRQQGDASNENPFSEPDDSDRTVIRPVPGGRRSPPDRITEQPPAPQEAPRRPYAGETSERKDSPRPAALPSLRRGVIGTAAAVFVALLGIGAGWFWFGTKAPIDRFHPPPAPSQPSQPPTPTSDFWANLPSLLWPAVAIVAIVALFLIARQAISTGSNVTIQWKVTEKVTGRVVITKVRERASRSTKAA
jgi:hypothetical protein